METTQNFVTAFSTDPERYWEHKDYAMDVAAAALAQIFGGLKADFGSTWKGVLSSWGCVTMTGTLVHKVLRWRDMPALALRVYGFEHEGWVIISLNEGHDVYEVELADEHFFARPDSRHEEVYCDQLGSLIDQLVERGTCSKAEYDAKIKAAHPLECWAKESGAKVMYFV